MTSEEKFKKIKEIIEKYGVNCGEDLWQSARFENDEPREIVLSICQIVYDNKDF